MHITIRRVYLYLTSLIGLVLILIGSVQLLNLGLKTFIFTKADDQYYYGACERPVMAEPAAKPVPEFDKDECEKQRSQERGARRQNQAANSIAFILVGAPVWLYHWGKVKNEKDETNV